MEIPPDTSHKIFEKEFKRGVVLSTVMRFRDGQSKKKYLIVINNQPSDSETLYFLTTSKVDFFFKHPHILDRVKIEANALPFFPLLTIIDCRQVYYISREELKTKFQKGILIFEGILPVVVMAQIDQIVAQSRLISPRDRILILGWQ